MHILLLGIRVLGFWVSGFGFRILDRVLGVGLGLRGWATSEWKGDVYPGKQQASMVVGASNSQFGWTDSVTWRVEG